MADQAQAQPQASAHDEKLLEIFRRGALMQVVLAPLTRDSAHSLRMRLYRLKRTLIKENHPDAHSASLSMTRIRQLNATESGWTVIVQPSDMDYEEAFTSAGITNPRAPDDLPDLE